jgi:hypothetical protein
MVGRGRNIPDLLSCLPAAAPPRGSRPSATGTGSVTLLSTPTLRIASVVTPDRGVKLLDAVIDEILDGELVLQRRSPEE